MERFRLALWTTLYAAHGLSSFGLRPRYYLPKTESRYMAIPGAIGGYAFSCTLLLSLCRSMLHVLSKARERVPTAAGRRRGGGGGGRSGVPSESLAASGSSGSGCSAGAGEATAFFLPAACGAHG